MAPTLLLRGNREVALLLARFSTVLHQIKAESVTRKQARRSGRWQGTRRQASVLLWRQKNGDDNRRVRHRKRATPKGTSDKERAQRRRKKTTTQRTKNCACRRFLRSENLAETSFVLPREQTKKPAKLSFPTPTFYGQTVCPWLVLPRERRKSLKNSFPHPAPLLRSASLPLTSFAPWTNKKPAKRFFSPSYGQWICQRLAVFLFCQLCDIAKSGYDPQRRFTQIWLQEKYEN
jgi:hypothetical protein